MKDNTRIRLIEESSRIYRRFVWYTFLLIVGIVVLLRPETVNNSVLFGGSIAAIIVSLVAIALNILLVNGLDSNDDPPAVTYEDVNDASDMLTFETAVPQPTVRLYQSDDNLIRIGRYQLTRRQWRTLATTLANLNWRWTRANIGKAKVIKNLTAPGIYPGMTRDMERLGVVDKGRVTASGRDIICEAAGLDVVI